MKKMICGVCAVALAATMSLTPVLAGTKTTSVDKAAHTVTVSTVYTAEEIQAKIDALKAKSAELAAKHQSVIDSHPSDSAKAAKIKGKTDSALEKHNAAIEYYENLLKEMNAQ